MKKSYIAVFVAGFILVIFITLAFSLSPIKEFSFLKKDSLDAWSLKVFKGSVVYEVRQDAGIGYIYAKSDKTCTGLYYKIKFNCAKFSMISWKWKVMQFPSKKPSSKTIDKKTDDYALRLYVIFPSIFFPNSKAIEYVWDEWVPEGTTFSSPYTANIKIIAVHSGRQDMDKWVMEERNIYEDYKKVFGRPPRLDVGAIALMTNSDNSQSISEAGYADIKLGYELEKIPITVEKKYIKSVIEKIMRLFRRR